MFEISIRTIRKAVLSPKEICRHGRNQNILTFNVGNKMVIETYSEKSPCKPGVKERRVETFCRMCAGRLGRSLGT